MEFMYCIEHIPCDKVLWNKLRLTIKFGYEWQYKAHANVSYLYERTPYRWYAILIKT